MTTASQRILTGRALFILPLVSAVVIGCAGTVDPAGVDDSESLVVRGVKVDSAARHDTSPPLTLIPPAPSAGSSIEHEVKRLPRPASHYAGLHDRVAQSQAPLLLMPATTLNFLGMGNSFSGPSGAFSFAGTPPYTNGDAGPNHYVQTVNTSFAIFNKSGTALLRSGQRQHPLPRLRRGLRDQQRR